MRLGRHASSALIASQAVGISLTLTLILTFSMSARADDEDNESSFRLSLNVLRDLDSDLQNVADTGVVEWAEGKAVTAASKFFPDLFGSHTDAAREAKKAGTHVYDIAGRGSESVVEMLDTMDGSSANEFFDWLAGDKLPDLADDLIPDSVRRISENAKRVVRDVQEFETDILWSEDGPSRMIDNAGEIATDTIDDVAETAAETFDLGREYGRGLVGDYFDESAQFGLEPGGDETNMLDQVASDELDEIGMDPVVLGNVKSYVEEDPLAADVTVWDEYYSALERQQEADANMNADQRSDEPGPHDKENAFAADIVRLEQEVGFLEQDSSVDFSGDIARLSEELGGEPVARGEWDWGGEAQRAEEAIHDWEEEQRRKADEQARIAAIREQQELERRTSMAEMEAFAATAPNGYSDSSGYEETRADDCEESSGGFFGSVMRTAAEIHMAKEYGLRPGWTDPCGGQGSGGSYQDGTSTSSSADRPMPTPSPGVGVSGSDSSACASASRKLNEIIQRGQASVGNTVGMCATFKTLMETTEELLRHPDIRACPGLEAQVSSVHSQAKVNAARVCAGS